MPRRFLDTLVLVLPLSLLLNACLEHDYKNYSINVQVRGLASNESITVSNGSSIQIFGTEDLSWTEAQKFKKGYREDKPNYSISITRQPSNSNKACRILNPKGKANYSTSVVRIECGYPLVVTDNFTDYPTVGTMTTNNGLMVSNGLQNLALNSSRSLVTSLEHSVVQNPNSSNANVKKLSVVSAASHGAIIFDELYLEGEQINLSHTSINQGCEIAGVTGSIYSFPNSDTFMNTVQTIPLEQDWIEPGSKYSEGRTCQDFLSSSVYLLDFACELDDNGACILSTESEPSATEYTATCYPAPMVEVTCGFALKLNVTGIEIGDTVDATATRNPLSTNISHTQSFNSNSGRKTFNLAFEAGDDYEIEFDAPDYNCTFSSLPVDPNTAAGTTNGNTVETLNCTLIP